MAHAMGSNSRLAYQRETTFGITPTSIDMRTLYFLNESLQEKTDLVTSQVIRGNRNPTKPVRGNRSVGGSIKTELAPSLGPLFRGVMGSLTTTGAGTPYTHTLKVGDLPSFTFEKGFPDIPAYSLFNGCKVAKMSLSCTPSGFQEVSFDLMGVNEGWILPYDAQSGTFTVGLTVTGGTSGATARIIADNDGGVTGTLTVLPLSGTFVNDETITDSSTGSATANLTAAYGAGAIDSSVTDPGHSPWEGFSIAAILEGGSSIATVTSVDNLTIENDLDGGIYCVGGGGIRRSIPDGKVRVSGTLTALFDSLTLYRKAIAFTESSLKITYNHGTGAGTAGNESLEILVPELVYAKETPVIEGPNGILYKGPFEAYYDNASEATSIQMILKSAEATI